MLVYVICVIWFCSSVHPSISPSIHFFFPSFVSLFFLFVRTHAPSFFRSFVPAFVLSFVRVLVSLIHSLARSFVRAVGRSAGRSVVVFVCSFVRLLDLFIHYILPLIKCTYLQHSDLLFVFITQPTVQITRSWVLWSADPFQKMLNL